LWISGAAAGSHKTFHEDIPVSRVLGIDISPDMVKLARAVNREAISNGRANISCESVEEISIESKSVNLITIFDNINFWTSYEKLFLRSRES
jgi:SAM-dependent methyltransferase